MMSQRAAAPFGADDVMHLRQSHYNATVVEVRRAGSDLRIFRVVPDGVMPEYRAGQYTSLGMGYWEPRVEGVQAEQLDEVHRRRMAKRAYSVSCALLDQGRLVRVTDCEYLEFYVALVRHAVKHPPALTPRLFALRPGDRLFVEPRYTGGYTLDPVGPGDTVVFFATGTGEAPHNAMLAELLSRGHRGPVVGTICVRWRRDLAYAAVHRELETRYDNYRYLPLTTREPENLDASHPGFVGKRYLQQYVASGDFERDAGVTLDPQRTQAFLCGNPTMIGVPRKRSGSRARVPQPGGMIDLLSRRGFRAGEPHRPGNVHFERYW